MREMQPGMQIYCLRLILKFYLEKQEQSSRLHSLISLHIDYKIIYVKEIFCFVFLQNVSPQPSGFQQHLSQRAAGRTPVKHSTSGNCPGVLCKMTSKCLCSQGSAGFTQRKGPRHNDVKYF